MKRIVLIGSLSGPKFAIRTDKMDSSRINFGEMLSPFVAQIGSFLFSSNLFTFKFGGQFLLNVHKRDVRNLPLAGAFIESRELKHARF